MLVHQESFRPVQRRAAPAAPPVQIKRRKGATSRGGQGLSITHFFTADGAAAVDY